MKRIIAVIVCLLLILSMFSGCGKTSREETLRIYNWEDYIDPEVLDDFKAYYFEKYGVELNIQYETFDTNETMYTKIEKAHEDYDLCCPSEYIIEKMVKNGLTIQLDENIVGEIYKNNVPDYIREKFAAVTGNTDTDIYSVGYMWGTLGIIYNTDEVSLEDLENEGWAILWNEKYAGKIFMKDSIRDSYAVGNLYVYQQNYLSLKEQYEKGEITLSQYSDKVQELFNRTDDATIELIENALKTQKDTVDAMYDVDNDKNSMVNGTAYLDVAWSGDARWAIIEAQEANNSVNLDYYIPKEGTNVWFDGWVIPKYAKNLQAANEFIAYLLNPEVAIKIMDYIGYPSVASSEEIFEYGQEQAFNNDVERDVSYFFDNENASSAVVTQTMYPDASLAFSGAVMKDFGDANENINNMWARVKGNTLTVFVYIVDCLVGLGLVYLIVIRIMKWKKARSVKGK